MYELARYIDERYRRVSRDFTAPGLLYRGIFLRSRARPSDIILCRIQGFRTSKGSLLS